MCGKPVHAIPPCSRQPDSGNLRPRAGPAARPEEADSGLWLLSHMLQLLDPGGS
eukprot:m.210047 g.210047  ORF g.210047 m.210047 type:complete len:54 (+) comp10134_c0_seq109:739-900(+)